MLIASSQKNLREVLVFQHGMSHVQNRAIRSFNNLVLLRSVWCREISLNPVFIAKRNKLFGCKLTTVTCSKSDKLQFLFFFSLYFEAFESYECL